MSGAMGGILNAFLGGVKGAADSGAEILHADRDLGNRKDLAQVEADIMQKKQEAMAQFNSKLASENETKKFDRDAADAKLINERAGKIIGETYEDPENVSDEQHIKAKMQAAEELGRLDYADKLRKQLSEEAALRRAEVASTRMERMYGGGGSKDPAELQAYHEWAAGKKRAGTPDKDINIENFWKVRNSREGTDSAKWGVAIRAATDLTGQVDMVKAREIYNGMGDGASTTGAPQAATARWKFVDGKMVKQ